MAWQLSDSVAAREVTLVLRETGGVGVRFTTVKVESPLPPTGWGREWFGGMGEGPFVHRLAPHASLETRLTRGPGIVPPSYTDYEFRGVDETGHPVRVKVRVHWR